MGVHPRGVCEFAHVAFMLICKYISGNEVIFFVNWSVSLTVMSINPKKSKQKISRNQRRGNRRRKR